MDAIVVIVTTLIIMILVMMIDGSITKVREDRTIEVANKDKIIFLLRVIMTCAVFTVLSIAVIVTSHSHY